MVLFAGGSALPAVLWWTESAYLTASALAYVVLYLAIYRRLVRFGKRAKQRDVKPASGYVARRVAALHRAAASRRTARETNKGP
jgi:hypothetical protein